MFHFKSIANANHTHTRNETSQNLILSVLNKDSELVFRGSTKLLTFNTSG